ncbi:thiol reductant ABC exporter subunit CydC [Mycolicibacterium brumae]|uniref:Thiol reductant ABC exporter subunit CydC n=1 Tax=Mycolicibacterium brumae TaxID=85968 RepID=A0A2G5P867_9MYCO|nr:thiol reductant ABC exporter subunit CydC [Mycolicibacterium brumae]MCV7194613.1 thiol reductant ABC exporter subunit CydC [Mycolicibacterium brumae]PIB74213.1 thiol reductant ABC exporter subunit CydC [Mycolicibacterium brumae]RWA22950.1 hypothetical protein MBRU_11460 [Mycolicibacterium brumae DSM 44177]UWW08952.1 thiol reductant ABC exporter subunit CydC [Mycolicibacterium brumae]
MRDGDPGDRADPLWQALALLRPRLPRLLLAIALGVGSLGSALALAGVSAWLIARAWQMPPILDLSVAVVAVRAFGISRGVLHYCERLVSHDEALTGASNARAQTYRRLVARPAALRVSGGELAGRVGADVDELSEVLVRAVLPIAVAAVLSVAAVGAIALISPVVAAVLAICLLVAGMLAPWLAARGAAAAELSARERHADRDEAAVLALRHGPELRVAGRLPGLIAQTRARQRDWGAELDRAAAPASLGAAAPTLALGAAVLAAAVVGIGLSPTLDAPILAILMLLPLSSFEATTALPAAAVQLTRSRIAARRLLELTGNPRAPEPAGRLRRASSELVPRPSNPPVDRPPGPEPDGVDLRADNLCSGFPGASGGFSGSLDVAAGARVAVTGPSGAGKTALLLTLAGLIPPQQGCVTVGGVALSNLNEAQLRSRIGYFAEDAHIFETTVRDNLLVVRGDCADAELQEALRRVGLGEWLAGLPGGLGTVLTGGASAVSAGQRRRLLLARALCSRAPVLLLDEPTEHLDIGDAEPVLDELLRVGGLFGPERTVVVATHHLPAGFAGQRIRVPG